MPEAPPRKPHLLTAVYALCVLLVFARLVAFSPLPPWACALAAVPLGAVFFAAALLLTGP